MDRISRYRIEGELGRGAMGVVYKATDTTIGRTVAIKMIRLNDLVDSSEQGRLRDRLFREAQSAGRLSHPNIVTVYDIAEEDDLAYIAMEYVDGPTLEDLMQSGSLEGAVVLSVLKQTAAALDYAHKRGIVHRDIKPANIMMHEGSVAKITDFGVARIQSHQLTQAGSMVGTPNYMSPEQIQSQAVDGRSDQFSMGVIGYELMTGEKPFTGESIAQLAFRIVREDPAPLQRLNPTLDWPVDTVLRRALAKSPADRYPTCLEFVSALENACRACRKWTPIAPGASQAMATIAGPAIATPPVKVAEPAAPPALPGESESAPDDAPPVPPVLRAARTVALFVLGTGLVFALFMGGLRWWGPANAPEPPAVKPRAEEPLAKRPSSIPALPGDRGDPPVAEIPVAPESPAPPSVELSPGEARLVTNPPGAMLVVDARSDQSCQSPCTLPLRPGRHTLTATMEGYRRALRIFELPRDRELFLNLDRLSGNLAVRSEPAGATILINGQERSEKTPAMLFLPVGEYTVEVVREGKRERQEVTVRESATTSVAVSLED